MMNNVLRFSGCINSASVDAGKCGGKTMRNTQKINNNDKKRKENAVLSPNIR